MPFVRQEETQRTIAQSSSSSSPPSNSSCLPSNNNKTHDDGHLQSTNMSTIDQTKDNKTDTSLLIRLKVRFHNLFCFQIINYS
jgi:hypothetical protein